MAAIVSRVLAVAIRHDDLENRIRASAALECGTAGESIAVLPFEKSEQANKRMPISPMACRTTS